MALFPILIPWSGLGGGILLALRIRERDQPKKDYSQGHGSGKFSTHHDSPFKN
jgi:hypothetical protein